MLMILIHKNHFSLPPPQENPQQQDDAIHGKPHPWLDVSQHHEDAQSHAGVSWPNFDVKNTKNKEDN